MLGLLVVSEKNCKSLAKTTVSSILHEIRIPLHLIHYTLRENISILI